MENEVKKYISSLDIFLFETELLKKNLKTKDIIILASIEKTKKRLFELRKDLEQMGKMRFDSDADFRVFDPLFSKVDETREKAKKKKELDEFDLFSKILKMEAPKKKKVAVNDIDMQLWLSYNNIKELIKNLHTVLWKDVDWKVQPEDITTDSDVKKYYKKALLLVHPDKVNDENKPRATQIYIKLSETYKRVNLSV
jgi:hypothetical protein